MTESLLQKKFVQQKKKEKRTIIFARWMIFILFLALWELSSSLHWIDSFIFSCPSQIVKTFFDMVIRQNLFSHIGATLFETFVSFILVTFLGMLLSLILWISPRLSAVCEPYLIVLNSLPKSALAPLLIVWLGANQKTIIVAGISVALFGSVISLYTGFQEIDPDDLKLIRTLGGTKKDTLFKVVLPASVPYLLSVMKVNIGLCLVGVVIGEFIGARKGLGHLIIYSSQVFKMNWMLLSIVLLCIISMGLYSLLNFIEKKMH